MRTRRLKCNTQTKTEVRTPRNLDQCGGVRGGGQRGLGQHNTRPAKVKASRRGRRTTHWKHVAATYGGAAFNSSAPPCLSSSADSKGVFGASGRGQCLSDPTRGAPSACLHLLPWTECEAQGSILHNDTIIDWSLAGLIAATRRSRNKHCHYLSFTWLPHLSARRPSRRSGFNPLQP